MLLCVSKLLNEGKKVRFYIDGDISKKSNDSNVNYTYSKEELECIGRIDSLLKEFNQDGVYFNEQKRIDSYKDQGSLWSYDDVKYANERIDEIVDVINTNNLSPFEIVLFIHEYITNNFTYDSNALDGQNPRMLPGVFKNGSIVCSGYASIVKAIIDRLDNPNLKCMIVGCTLRDPTSQEELQFQYSNHCHNLVYVKDEKYGIDGFYIEDSSWDSKVKGKKDGYGISNCLYPIEDLFHHNNVEYYHKFYYSREKNLLETVVHPYFRKPSRYKNKDKIAEIVRLYKNKSKPIDIEVYRRGVKALEPLLDIDSDMEIEKSIKTASIICDTDAISCFSRCRNRKEDR